MFIYLIVNHVTGKYYVGQHKGTDLRKYLQKKFWAAGHQLYGSSRLFNSMRKHGREAFTIHALLSNIQTRPELDTYEKDFITFLRSQDPEYGYNICRGGEGFTGPHTEEARKKNSIASRAMWNQPGKRESIVSNMKQVSGECRAIGGRAGGRAAVESGQLDSVRAKANEGLRKWIKDHPKEHLAAVSRGGQKNVESGHMARMRAKSDLAAGGRTAGRMAAENGQLASMRCKQWNINRGKPCVCGKHVPKPIDD